MKIIVRINAQDFTNQVDQADGEQIKKSIDAAVKAAMKVLDDKLESRRREFEQLKRESTRVLACLQKALGDDIKVDVTVQHNQPFTVTPAAHNGAHKTPAKPEKPATVGDLSLNKTQQRILDALAWYESIGITEPTSLQVGAIALIDVTGGHFSNTVGPLSSGGLIERDDGVIRLTEAGRAVAKLPARLHTLEEYHDMLRNRVRKARSATGKTVEVLDAIIAGGGAELSSEEVGAAVGIDHTGGHFSNTIGPLGTLGLIERKNGKVKPTNLLFPEGVF
jgi:hypothetical protein